MPSLGARPIRRRDRALAFVVRVVASRVLLITLSLLLVAADAAVRLSMGVGDIEGPGWRASGVAVEIDVLAEDRAGLRLSAKQIELPEPLEALVDVEVSCAELRAIELGLRCESGSARFTHPRLGAQRAAVEFEYRSEGLSELRFDGLRFGEGAVAGRASWGPKGWDVSLVAAAVPLDRLVDSMGGKARSVEISVAGTASFRARFSGVNGSLSDAAVEGEVDALGFSDAESTRVGEGLVLAFDAKARRAGERWGMEANFDLTAGELYWDPVYVAVPKDPIRVVMAGAWSPTERALDVASFELDHGGLIDVQGEGMLGFGDAMSLLRLDLRLVRAHLPTLYGNYVQPFLIGTALDDLETAGQLSGELSIRDGRIMRAQTSLRDVYVDDRSGRFGLYDADGDLEWRRDPQPVASKLRFAGGHVLGIDLGGAEVALASTDRTLSLAEPASIPVLDGRLNVESFAMGGLDEGRPVWRFDAGLAPISMERLTHALGWPVLAGKLSGMIPDVQYANGVVTVGGALLVRVFDGTVTVHNLRLEEPLGIVPRLSADVVVDDLDLQRLTRRFEFGQITGKLDGEIRDLRLVAWKPVSFDASFATPEDDDSRHRISQRAVDNLTRVGSGVSGVLSSGFLSLFEHFAYDRIGLSCRLSNGVCEMDGVAPAQNGYYIVRGWGLPRVDVIGYNRRVAWDVLIERLKSRLERPTVVQ